MTEPVRFGIVGTGDISRQFATDLAHVDGAELVAVGSRRQETADRFGDTHGIPRRHPSYEALADDPDVDVIYIGTPHSFHCENTVLFLEHGKHVVVEKPMAVNARQVARMLEAARKADRFLMEAVWMYFFPGMIKMTDLIAEGAIGTVRLVRAELTFGAAYDPTGRLFNPQLAGGALLDVGVYPLALAQRIYGAPPERVSSQAVMGETGVDEQVVVAAKYPGGGLAALSCGLRVNAPKEGIIAGTDGLIAIPDPIYSPDRFALRRGDDEEWFEFEREGYGYHFEAAEAVRCVREGLRESPLMPLAASYALAETLDALRAEWGLRYPMEED